MSPSSTRALIPQTRISIFLNVFNVHVNRSPIAGVIRDVRYQRGKFLNAMGPNSADENEQNIVTVEGEGRTVVFKQIAGLIARRIVFNLKVGRHSRPRPARRPHQIRLARRRGFRFRRRRSRSSPAITSRAERRFLPCSRRRPDKYQGAKSSAINARTRGLLMEGLSPRRRDTDRPRGRMRKGMYILPSVFTTANIAAGFYAILETTRGRWPNRGISISPPRQSDLPCFSTVSTDVSPA